MSAAAGGQNGIGPELRQVMNQPTNQGNGSPLNQNSAAPGGVAAVPPAPAGGGMPAPAGGAPGGAPQMVVPANSGNDLQIALKALAGYIGSHGKVHEQKHGINKNPQPSIGGGSE